MTDRTFLGRDTILADASYCDRTRAAGWAGAIMLTDGRTNKVSGQCDWTISNSSRAEALAMHNAVRWAITEDYLKPGAKILLATDAQYVWHRMQKDLVLRADRRRVRRTGQISQTLDPQHGCALRIVRHLLAGMDVDYECIQIRGHTAPAMKRNSPLNRLMGDVDRLSRIEMTNMRALYAHHVFT